LSDAAAGHMLRRVKLRAGMIALPAVLIACGSSMASGVSPAHLRCGPAGARTISSSGQARAYSCHGDVYGCSLPHGRSFRLGSTARSLHESRVQPVVIAGADAAYGLASFGVDTVSATVIVRRLTDGRRLVDFAATRSGLVEGVQSVRSLALNSNGAVAWIGVAHSIVAHREVIEVHAVASGSGSADRVLDSGPQVAPTSLRIHGSMLTWRHGATTRHATLG
jgi:hypothetical protein